MKGEKKGWGVIADQGIGILGQQQTSIAAIPGNLTKAGAKGRPGLDLPDDIRPCGIEQLDQPPSAFPVPVGVEECNHTGYELPV